MRLSTAAAREQRRRDWMVCQEWHQLAERRQGELDTERARRDSRKRRAGGPGRAAAAYATALLARRYRLTPTRLRQIVHQQQSDAWKRSRQARSAATAMIARLNASHSPAERALIIDETDPSSRVAQRRSKLRTKRARDAALKRQKRARGKKHERMRKLLIQDPILSAYSTGRRRI
jgi:hypothetical protein